MNKRGAGEGSKIEFRSKENRWEAKLSFGFKDGRRQRRSYYGATAAEVREKLLRARSDYANGLPVMLERQTVEQFLADWLERSLKPRAKPRALESFATIARLHIVPKLGRLQLRKLQPQHIQRLLDDKSKQGLSPQTVTNIRTVLRSALAQATKWGLIARNSAALVDAPRIPKKQITPLDPNNARKLIEAAKGSRFEAVYVIALNLGLRRGEVLGLRWSDIEFDSQTLRVNQSVQRLLTDAESGPKSALRATETKTDGSRRTMAVPDAVVRALRLQRAKQAQQRLVAGFQWNGSHDLIFTNQTGGPLEPKVLTRDYKALLKQAGLPTTLRFHDLRHSAATLLLAQGVHPRAIMEILGHSSITVTMNTYGHVLPAMLREAADKMDAILG
jgi:integrase